MKKLAVLIRTALKHPLDRPPPNRSTWSHASRISGVSADKRLLQQDFELIWKLKA